MNMKNKINIAKLLKNCPKDIELDCTMYESVKLDYIAPLNTTLYPIKLQTPDGQIGLNDYGCYSNNIDAKCVIFPKGKTTWEGFVPPCEFEDGDIITCNNGFCTFISIFKDNPTKTTFRLYCSIIVDNNTFKIGIKHADYINPRLATKDEKEKLFKAINDNSYKWDPETKTLKKLPKFKIGDRIKSIFNNTKYDIKEITNTHYTLIEIINKFQYTEPIIEDENWELVTTKEDIKDWLAVKYPLTIVLDRYNGNYSKGKYIAFPLEPWEINCKMNGNDVECMNYWDNYTGIVGKGNTPDEAKLNLIIKMYEKCI